MNKENRKQLNEALNLIEQANGIIESVKDDEQDKFDNMPENLQGSERGERLESIISELEYAVDNLNDCRDNIEEAIQ